MTRTATRPSAARVSSRLIRSAASSSDPERYLAQIRDVIVCPGCLAEKPAAVMVPVEYQGTVVYFCGCPGCSAAFERDPERLLARLAV